MAAITISGGDKWKAYLERLAQKAEVRAGVLEGATNIETRQLVAEYAAYNEFGTSRIPARPFMRTTLQEQRGEWVQGLGRLLDKRRGQYAVADKRSLENADFINFFAALNSAVFSDGSFVYIPKGVRCRASTARGSRRCSTRGP